ncbi:Galactocerebrosidase, partial [Geodia barretti]
MTSTISWNLIASYYSGLPYFRDGLMTATEPWSGHYEVMGPIWIAAHTTQFSEIGYYYLKQGYGAGHLASGGSYVTLYDPKTNDFSIIIETMTRNHSVCVRPDLPPYNVTDQTATFQLKGSLGNVTELNCWISSLKYGSGEVSEYFQEASPVMVKDGIFSVTLPVDTVMTLSTLTGQKKGSFPSVPPSAPFPLPYSDDFDDYPDYSEAQFFADQTGVFEITNASDPSHGKVMRQVVPTEPINWCYRPAAGQPNTIIGNSSWHRVFAEVSVLLEGEGTAVFLAARMSQGGCGVAKATGVFLWLDSAGFYNITTDLAGNEQLKSGRFSVLLQQWYTLQIKVEHTSVSVRVSGNRGASVSDSAEAKNNRPGFVALGTGGYYP